MTSVKWLHNPRIDRYQAESMVRLLTDTADPRVEINKPFDGRKKKCGKHDASGVDNWRSGS
jgi:hypothetical protein